MRMAFRFMRDHVLREAWMGDGTGRAIPETSLERGLKDRARDDAAAPGSVTVTLPAL